MNTKIMEDLIKKTSGPLAALFACLVLQSRDKTFFGETEVSTILGRTTKSARSYLRQLAQIGFITRTQHRTGWILTTMGRQQLLSVTIRIGQNSDALPEFEPVNFTGSAEEEVKRTGKNYRFGKSKCLEPVNFTGSDPVVVVNNLKQDSVLVLTQQQQHETVKITVSKTETVARKICQAAALLLGEEIWPEKVIRWLETYERRRACHPELEMPAGLTILAGWIVQLHAKPPRQYDSLAAICAANVIGGRMPREEYLTRWWTYTGEEFNNRLFEVVECFDCWGDPCRCEDANGET